MSKIDTQHPKLLNVNKIAFACLFFVLSFFCPSVYAQPYTQAETTADSTITKMEYLNLWEYAFRMNEETSWLLKFDLGSVSSLQVSFEKRIASSLSLNLGTKFNYSFGIVYSNYYSLSVFDLNSLSPFIETRWYYRQNKRVKNNEVARNMSDNYFALGLSYTYQLNTFNSDYISLYSKWGLQRRFLSIGHVDIGIKAGIGYAIHEDSPPFFTFSTYVDLGMAYTKDKYKIDYAALCPVLKCYQADKFIIKANLSNLFYIAMASNETRISVSPRIAFERKIGESPFSLNAEIIASYFYDHSNRLFPIGSDMREYFGFSFGFSLESRYYYNLKRRILTGKSGNGLSANYIAIGGDMAYRISKSTIINVDGFFADGYIKNATYDKAIYIMTGWQRLFGKHMYYDMNIGIEYNSFRTNYWYISSRFHIAVGYRF